MTDLIQGSYIASKRFYAEQTEEDFFEFHFPYVSTNSNFRELDRFLWESRHEKTRFKNRYSGPVLIDLTEWNRNEPNVYFEAFMYFLLDYTDLKCTFILQEKGKPEFMEKLNSFFEINTIELEVQMESAAPRRIGFYIE